MTGVGEERLDDPDALAEYADTLRATATAGARMRAAAYAAADADLAAITAAGRPRSVVVIAAGDCRDAGRLLAALCGPGCPVPVTVLDAYRLPGWVGVADLVIAVSCSGRFERTVELAAQARRRGCLLVGVGPRPSPLAELCAGAPYLAAPDGDGEAGLWSLAVPLLAVASRIGLLGPQDYEAAAGVLDDIGGRCAPAAPTPGNPAKTLAVDLLGSIPLVVADDPGYAAVAARFARRIRQLPRYPAISGELPAGWRDHGTMLDGPYGAGAGADDLFRDRVADPFGSAHLRLVSLRDAHRSVPDEAAWTIAGFEAWARRAGVPVSGLESDGDTALARVGRLLAVTDFAAVYLAVATAASVPAVPG